MDASMLSDALDVSTQTIRNRIDEALVTDEVGTLEIGRTTAYYLLSREPVSASAAPPAADAPPPRGRASEPVSDGGQTGAEKRITQFANVNLYLGALGVLATLYIIAQQLLAGAPAYALVAWSQPVFFFDFGGTEFNIRLVSAGFIWNYLLFYAIVKSGGARRIGLFMERVDSWLERHLPDLSPDPVQTRGPDGGER